MYCSLIVRFSRLRGTSFVIVVVPTPSVVSCPSNQDLDRDNFMSAQAAADYGLVDNVIKLSKK